MSTDGGDTGVTTSHVDSDKSSESALLADSSGRWSVCGKRFSGYAGAWLHLRRAHPGEFHGEAMMKLERSRNKMWTMEEGLLMVAFKLSNPEVQFSNQYILKHVLLEKRTVDSFFGHHRSARYHRLLMEKRLEKEAEASP